MSTSKSVALASEAEPSVEELARALRKDRTLAYERPGIVATDGERAWEELVDEEEGEKGGAGVAGPRRVEFWTEGEAAT